ncbi:MAG: sulfatase-like hydrolase/transferase, partial [Holophagales bacterium]|nr:sulfatase-like hydrolase/transferase [Holophagales bacterium]
MLRRRARTLAARRERAGGDAGYRRGTRARRPPGEVIFLALVALLAGATATQPDTVRPNVLWIDIDDQSPWYSSYGHDLVETPNIDALARQGVLFERAYAPTPVCSPTRSSLITGSYAIRICAHDHRSGRVPGYRIHLPEGVVTVPELFRA